MRLSIISPASSPASICEAGVLPNTHGNNNRGSARAGCAPANEQQRGRERSPSTRRPPSHHSCPRQSRHTRELGTGENLFSRLARQRLSTTFAGKSGRKPPQSKGHPPLHHSDSGRLGAFPSRPVPPPVHKENGYYKGQRPVPSQPGPRAQVTISRELRRLLRRRPRAETVFRGIVRTIRVPTGVEELNLA